MTERTWIKIHNGLTNDAGHRVRMGNRIWYFMWLVDHADWESGIVPDHTDKWAADEMNMKIRTIEDQRQSLEQDNYILCERQFQKHNIRIMRWRNPRAVNARQINIPGKPETFAEYGKSRSRATENPVVNPTEISVVLPLVSQESHKPSNGHGNVWAKAIEELWGFAANSTDPEMIEGLAEKYGAAEVREAMKICAQKNKRFFSFLAGILERKLTPVPVDPVPANYKENWHE